MFGRISALWLWNWPTHTILFPHVGPVESGEKMTQNSIKDKSLAFEVGSICIKILTLSIITYMATGKTLKLSAYFFLKMELKMSISTEFSKLKQYMEANSTWASHVSRHVWLRINIRPLPLGHLFKNLGLFNKWPSNLIVTQYNTMSQLTEKSCLKIN